MPDARENGGLTSDLAGASHGEALWFVWFGGEQLLSQSQPPCQSTPRTQGQP